MVSVEEGKAILEEWLEDQIITDNIHEAIFILEDGTLIDGEFDMGMRGIDHNCIISVAPDELSHNKKWEYIHNLNVIRLVPETDIALINVGQQLTDIQIELLKDTSYEIEEY